MAQGTTKGVPIDIDPLLAADSDLLVPSQKAVKTYIDNSNVNQVTSVTGTSPIVSTGGTTPVISIPAATGSINGYLSSTDWTTFNGKQNALSGTGIVKSTTGTISYLTDNSTNWDTAYTDRLKWDGGSTGLVAATGRTSLGANTVGSNLFTLTNPSAITFIRINADNSISTLDAASFVTAIGVTSSQWITSGSNISYSTGNVAIGTTPVATSRLNITDTTLAGSGSLAGNALSINQTWNTTGSPTVLLMNITNTASGGSTVLMDLRIGGVSQFRVDKFGNSIINGSVTSGLGVISNRPASSPGSAFSWTSTNNTFTSGVFNAFVTTTTINPSSGTGEFNIFNASPVINQTGGANGITRGLYIAPTLTAAADFRAIEATNGSVVLPYATASATYAVKTSDYLLNFTSGTFTATLPTAVGCTGKHYIFKNTGSGIITIATTSSQTIDGVTTYVLAASLNKYVHVVSTGSNWIVIANN
jgi:hypothetical protein